MDFLSEKGGEWGSCGKMATEFLVEDNDRTFFKKMITKSFTKVGWLSSFEKAKSELLVGK